MIVNNAIEKAEKKSMRKLFQSKYDKRGCLILRDKDFEVGWKKKGVILWIGLW